MKILVINPNTTEAMTDLVVGGLRRHLPGGTEILPMTAHSGDKVIATRQAFDAAAVTALAMLRGASAEMASCDAVVLACFGDPGLEDLRRAVSVPVVGLARASMDHAEKLGAPYAIVTAGPAWRDLLELRLGVWGASRLFKGVELLDATGLAILNEPDAMLPAVAGAVDDARRHGAERVILGGAVFAGYKDVMARHGVATDRVIDCVEAAAGALRQSIT